jgi:hypothetical protein
MHSSAPLACTHLAVSLWLGGGSGPPPTQMLPSGYPVTMLNLVHACGAIHSASES